MSSFIDNSKDAWGTSAVGDHFAGKNQGQKPGRDAALSRPAYGTAAWNPTVPTPGGAAFEQGNYDTANASLGRSLFNAPGQTLPRETGVNYTPANQAGHSTSQDPFQLADGFPGN